MLMRSFLYALYILNALKNLKNPRQVVRGVQGISKLAEKGAYSDVVFCAHMTLSEAYGSQTTSPLAERINDQKRKTMDGKLMLVDDDGTPLKKVDDPVNVESVSEVDEVFNETAGFMASMSSKVDNNSKNDSGVGNKS
ncbi:hypothetical protein Tco_1549315 [Tanacetum coccineum]